MNSDAENNAKVSILYFPVIYRNVTVANVMICTNT